MGEKPTPEKSGIVTTEIKHSWEVPGFITTGALLAGAVGAAYVAGQFSGYLYQWGMTGAEPDSLFSDTGHFFGLVADAGVMAWYVRLFVARSVQIVGLKPAAGLRRRSTAYERTHGKQSFAYSLSSGLGAVVDRNIRDVQRNRHNNQPPPTITVHDRFSLPETMFNAPNGFSVSDDVLVRWLASVERRDRQLGPGRGLSENYWTRLYKQSSGLAWWPGPLAWYACLGLVEQAEAELPLVLDIARDREYLNVPRPGSKRPLIVYLPGNKRRLALDARRTAQVVYSVHYREPAMLFDSYARQMKMLPH
jgi:hypothetical protein